MRYAKYVCLIAVFASYLSAVSHAGDGVVVAPAAKYRAGDSVGYLPLRGVATREAALDAFRSYTLAIAYNLKVNKGARSRGSMVFPPPPLPASEYVNVINAAEVERRISGLAFPQAENARYRIQYNAVADYTAGEPLPVSAVLYEDTAVAAHGVTLAAVTVKPKDVSLNQPNEDVGLAAAKLLADAVRSRFKALGVLEPYASRRLGVAVPDLEAMGAALKERRTPVTLSAQSADLVWRNADTPISIHWVAETP